jgi:hypothetical protein
MGLIVGADTAEHAQRPARARLRGEANVFVHAELREDRGLLVGAAKTGAGAAMRLEAGDIDIVYHYDAAHLLHSFIARATAPCFYDAIDEDGLDDLFGQLVLQWPEPLARHILAAGDAELMVVDA